MQIVIIPGFTGYPEEKTFQELGETLTSKGHTVTKIAWPHFPQDLTKYSFTSTISHARKTLKKLHSDNLILIGHSMGAIIATLLAKEFSPKKLVLLVPPYQAGNEDDLEGKYKEWKETGFRTLTSSKFGELTFPFSFIEDARKYNALEYIKEIHCPTLFITGEKDDKVPYKASRKLFELASEPKEWHLIPGMEHKYQYQPEMLRKVNKILIKFIATN
jgi:uncharacterized protein